MPYKNPDDRRRFDRTRQRVRFKRFAAVFVPTALPAPKSAALVTKPSALTWSDKLNCMVLDGERPNAKMAYSYQPSYREE